MLSKIIAAGERERIREHDDAHSAGDPRDALSAADPKAQIAQRGGTVPSVM